MTHFEFKAAIEKYACESHSNLSSSFFLPGLYMSNLVSQFLSSPDSPTNWAHANKVGIPLFMLLKRNQVLGKQVLAATKYMPPVDIVSGFMSVKKEQAQGVIGAV